MSIQLSRRGFLGAMLAASVAPLIVRSGVLMPIKPDLAIPILSLEDAPWVKAEPDVLQKMKDALTACYAENSEPDLMMCSPEFYAAFEQKLGENTRFPYVGQRGTFFQGVEVCASSVVTPNELYVISKPSLRFGGISAQYDRVFA